MMIPGLKIIRVGEHRVGLTGLEETFKEISQHPWSNEEKLADFLLTEISKDHYIPKNSENDYRKALLREYKRYIGEPVEEQENDGMTIRIFGHGCPSCDMLKKRVLRALSELRLDADLQLIADSGEITAQGMAATPAFSINGKIETIGKIPSIKEIKRLLKKHVV